VCRGYSLPFQRRITDFGAERSYERAAGQVLEHYGVAVSASTVRRITLSHGQWVGDQPALTQGEPAPADHGAQQLVAETDGSMIPTVTTEATCRGDRRKTRAVGWREARLSLVYEQGSTTPVYATTTGPVDDVGDQLAHSAAVIGMDRHTRIHAVGDGASWIPDQLERAFGSRYGYLIDFYHLSEYLAAASEVCATDARVWLKAQQDRMKAGDLAAVVEELKPHEEPESVVNDNAPVRACLRYIGNRTEYFDYPRAIEAELPIGSGRIEGGHRHVIQERLEITGAWWALPNAASMLALRDMRANGNWENYWQARAA